MRRKILAVVVFSAVLLGVLTACRGGAYNYGTVTFADGDHGWVTGFDAANKQTVISATTDGGATWDVVGTTGIGRAGRIVGPAAFSSPTTGVWCVYNDKVLYTTDGGATWTRSSVPDLGGNHFTAMSFADGTLGWAVSSGGGIFITTDGGIGYVLQRQAKVGGAFIDVVARSASICFALKDGLRCGVWATTDGGTTWTRYRLPGKAVHPIYCAIDFPSDLVGYAVGGGGKVAKTTDGGLTWTALTSGTRARLQGVCFVDELNGFAVGKRGTILHTTDGGTTWVAQTSGTDAMLNSVDFVGADTGWIVGQAGWAPGQEGVLLHTSDAGATWTQ